MEGVVIVGSILLAFGLQAWWEQKQEREKEQEVLSGLVTEFERYREELERRALRNDTLVAGLVALLEADIEATESMDTRGGDLALRAALYAGTWDPGSGTRDALVTSGRLELLRDEELRAALSSWGSVVEEVRDGELVIRDFVRESIVPMVASKGGPIDRAMSLASQWPARETSAPRSDEVYRQLFSDPSFRSLVQYKLAWQIQSGGEYVAALDATKEILTLLDGSLRHQDSLAALPPHLRLPTL